jgi:hypothetical protein
MKSALLALLGFIPLSTPLAVSAQQFGDFTYSSDGSAITITQYTGPGGAVTIPNTITGLPVTTIGSAAFYFTTSLTSVIIPDSVSSIGTGPFGACTSLTAINVENNNPAYSSVSGVLFDKSQTTLVQYPAGNVATSYVIPDSVTSIGDRAFSSCNSLTNITLGNGITSIGVSAFSHQRGLYDGSYVFEGCPLMNVTIPNSVTSIGFYAFAGCSRLTSVTIPENVIVMGFGAFEECSSLTNISVDPLNSAFSSADGVLFNQNQTTLVEYPGGKLGVYTIPNSVTSIGDSAFAFCSSLTGITIPNSVTSIGFYAFAFCSSLTGITIPTGVTTIAYDAFWNCSSLTSVYFQGNAPSVGSYLFGEDNATAYYLPGTTGWDSTFDIPTALWRLPYPLVLNNSLGAQSNQFGFTVSWATNLSVLVEASTDLNNPKWSPLTTNALSGGTFYFSDPQWTNYPSRFYRVRAQ